MASQRASRRTRTGDVWRAWTEPSTEIDDASQQWRARLLATVTLVGIPLALLVTLLFEWLQPADQGVPWWVNILPTTAIAAAYGLARSRYWRWGAWLIVTVTAATSFAQMGSLGEPYLAVFVGLAITMGSMVLRKRETQLQVALALLGFLTLPWWAAHPLTSVQQTMIAGFFVVLGIVLGVSVGVRETIEQARLDELAKSEARFRGLLEVAFEGLVELKEGRIVELNRGFVEITGRSASELQGRDLDAVLDLERGGPRTDRTTASLSQPLRPGTKEASGTRPDGEIFYVELVSRTLTSDRGPIEYVAVRDITEQRQAQLQLSIAHRAVALGTLSAGIAHEINNPLSWMMTNLQMAQDELRRGRSGVRRSPEHDGLLHTLDDALQGGRRVMSIVRDLKTMSREGSDQGVADVHAALDLACRIASRQIESRARLVRDYGHVPSVHGSAGRLGQVFLNLLTNAVQAIPEGKRDHNRIILRTRSRRNVVEVSVRDSGRGIPRKVLPHIFDPFYTTKGKQEGTGLGLSITRSVVHGMGGSISVESREGEGTTFLLRLPVSDRVAKPEPSAPVTRVETPVTSIETPVTRVSLGQPVRVLIIDDEPLLGKSLRRALHEHDVVFTEDPARALDLCSESDFDVIVCDLMMPLISGQDVYEQLREQAPDLATRIIFMTGGAFTAGAQGFLKSIDNPVLSKPFSPNDLRVAVKRMLEQHAA